MPDKLDDVISQNLTIALRKNGEIGILKRETDIKITKYVKLYYGKNNNIIFQFKENNKQKNAYKVSVLTSYNVTIKALSFFKLNNIIYEPGKYKAENAIIPKLGNCWVVYLDRKIER